MGNRIKEQEQRVIQVMRQPYQAIHLTNEAKPKQQEAIEEAKD
jgi:hypothetical protein